MSSFALFVGLTACGGASIGFNSPAMNLEIGATPVPILPPGGSGASLPTPTPTASTPPTVTPSPTPAPSQTVTPTPSPSPTATPAPAMTPTPSPSPTPTPVPTATPMASATPSPTATPIPMITPSPTPTPTPLPPRNAFLVVPEDSDQRLYSFKIASDGSLTSSYAGGTATTPSYKTTSGNFLSNANTWGVNSSTLSQMVDFAPSINPYPILLYSIDADSGALSSSSVTTLDNDQSLSVALDRSGKIGFMYGFNPLDSVSLVGSGTLAGSGQSMSTHAGYGMSGKPYFNSLGTLAYQTLNSGTYWMPGNNSAISVISIDRESGAIAELQTVSLAGNYSVDGLFLDPSEKVLFAMINSASAGYLASFPISGNGTLGNASYYATGATDGNAAYWFDPASDYVFVNATNSGNTYTRSFLMNRTAAVLNGTLSSGSDSPVELARGEGAGTNANGNYFFVRKTANTKIGLGQVTGSGTIGLFGAGMTSPESLSGLQAAVFSPYDNTLYVLGIDTNSSRLYSFHYDTAGNLTQLGSTLHLGAFAKMVSLFFTQPL